MPNQSIQLEPASGKHEELSESSCCTVLPAATRSAGNPYGADRFQIVLYHPFGLRAL
jgi:hypothetical protein